MLRRQSVSSNFTSTSSAIEEADQQQDDDAEDDDETAATLNFENLLAQQSTDYQHMENQQYAETDGVFENISIMNHTYYKNFIQHVK